jgi:hypothetical protein
MEKLVAYDLPLPIHLRRAGWKVKIRDKEMREPPHLTILRRTMTWRIDLRAGAFMDARPNPNEVPSELIQIIESHWILLCQQWNAMYPDNPVADPEV